LGVNATLLAQKPPATRPAGDGMVAPNAGGPGGFPGGFGGPGGMPFGPGGMGQIRKIVPTYDKDGDGRLNTEERKAAREAVKNNPGVPGGRRGPGGAAGPGGFGPPGMRANREPAKPGAKLAPADVAPVPAATPLYEPGVLRTLFLNFDSPDWEAELADFNNTDVEVPATLIVDGKTYPNVGVHFRGMSSFGMVPATYKRSLNVSLDYVDEKQRLLGYKTLNLLNGHEDPSFIHAALFSHIARQYIAAPKVNMVKVVINGENWGVYANAQQFDKIFADEFFPSPKKDKAKSDKAKSGDAEAGHARAGKTKVARWKVPGSPGGGGGLTYIGDDVAAYKRRYQIKSDDDADSWKALVELCRVLNQTPTEKLEAELSKILDVDGALWFLALDVVFSNGDGYWTRDSDYNILRDSKGVFHIVPHDMNETFSTGGGPGGMRLPFGPFGPGGGPPGGPGGPGGDPRGPAGGFDPRNAPPGVGEPRNQVGPADAPPGGQLPRPGDPRPGEGRPGEGRAGEGGRGFAGRGGRGPGMMGGGGVRLDPLVGLQDATKPLRSKLLAVPALRERYLAKVRTLATTWLDWQKLGPVVAQYRTLLDKEIEADTKKLESHEGFLAATSPDAVVAPNPPGEAPNGQRPQRDGDAPRPNGDQPRPIGEPPRPDGEPPRPDGEPAQPGQPALRGRRDSSLRSFVDQRRAYLLGLPVVRDAKE
jgi:hypothetical protein